MWTFKVEAVNGSATEEREGLDHATYHSPCNAEVFRLFSHQFGEGIPKK